MRRELPETDVARYVMTSHDRGDTPAQWQCTGVVVIDLPADVVARWAPGGSVVEHLDATRTRLTLGAWSWAGVAGLLATFDADIEIIEPDELSVTCAALALTAGTTGVALATLLLSRTGFRTTHLDDAAPTDTASGEPACTCARQAGHVSTVTAHHRLGRVVTTWLSAVLDSGS